MSPRKSIPLQAASIPHRKWLTMEEACIYMGLSRSILQNLKKTGAIGYSQPVQGGKLMLNREDMDLILAQSEVKKSA